MNPKNRTLPSTVARRDCGQNSVFDEARLLGWIHTLASLSKKDFSTHHQGQVLFFVIGQKLLDTRRERPQCVCIRSLAVAYAVKVLRPISTF